MTYTTEDETGQLTMGLPGFWHIDKFSSLG